MKITFDDKLLINYFFTTMMSVYCDPAVEILVLVNLCVIYRYK